MSYNVSNATQLYSSIVPWVDGVELSSHYYDWQPAWKLVFASCCCV